MKYVPLPERFWPKVAKGEGCWEWTAGKNAKGYGLIALSRPRRRAALAHRVAYELTFNTSIPDGVFACHKCDNPGCVNPSHLFLGTAFDNMRDCANKGRASRWQAEKTHCPKGHPYSPENTSINSNTNGRVCNECRRARDAERHVRKREELNQKGRERRARAKAADPDGFRRKERERALRAKAANPDEYRRRFREYGRAFRERMRSRGAE